MSHINLICHDLFPDSLKCFNACTVLARRLKLWKKVPPFVNQKNIWKLWYVKWGFRNWRNFTRWWSYNGQSLLPTGLPCLVSTILTFDTWNVKYIDSLKYELSCTNTIHSVHQTVYTAQYALHCTQFTMCTAYITPPLRPGGLAALINQSIIRVVPTQLVWST